MLWRLDRRHRNRRCVRSRRICRGIGIVGVWGRVMVGGRREAAGLRISWGGLVDGRWIGG